jgi:hypothetical protein
MQTVQELVTPEMAARWLERNKSNRPLRQTVVAAYAAQIKAGQWRLTHQGVCLDCKDSLIDGQHRLTAIVQTGIAILMQVSKMTTAESALALPLDVGAKRNYSDILNRPKKQVECGRLIAEMADGGSVKPSMQTIDNVCSKIESLHELGSAAFREAACSVRTGTILAVWSDNNREKQIVGQTLDYLKCDNMTEWWPSVQAFAKFINTRAASTWGNSNGRHELCMRWHMALTQPKSKVSRIADVVEYTQTIRAICNDIVNA